MSPRAEHRLNLAAGLLRLVGLPAESVLSYIKSLPVEQQEKIKSHVDWIEEYESV